MKTSIITLILFLIPTLIVAQGSSFKTGDLIRIDHHDTLSTQLISGGEWIEIYGHVQNDVYLAGRNIKMFGSTDDDAFLFGRSVEVSGIISDMLVSAGEIVRVEGNIGGDLFMAGKELRIMESAQITGHTFLAGENIRFDGEVLEGRVRLAGNSITVNGRFNRDVIIYSSDVIFGPEYSAVGGTKLVSKRSVYRENLGVIPPNLEIEIRQPKVLPALMFKVLFYLSLLVTGLVLLLLFRSTSIDMQRFSIDRFWKNTGVGVLTLLLTPFVILLLIIPVITIPLAGLTGLLFGFGLFVSYLLVAFIFGVQFLLWFQKEPSDSSLYLALAIGLLLIAILNNLPFVGWIFSILLLFFGLGSLMSYAWHKYRAKPV